MLNLIPLAKELKLHGMVLAVEQKRVKMAKLFGDKKRAHD